MQFLQPLSNLQKAAHSWFDFGFNVIPLIPHSKQTAVKWDVWLKKLSNHKISHYWLQNPTCEVGFIVGDEIIVFDADSPESISALESIEKTHGITPNLIVQTSKGVHHYFKRTAGTVAKSDAHCTTQFPKRIDVKTGRAMVVLPPSTGKTIVFIGANNANALVEAGQNFIDAVYFHNGRNIKVTSPRNQSSSSTIQLESNYLGLKALLARIDADCGYGDWLRVLMGIFHETEGSEEGFAIANAWSQGGDKYRGESEIRSKWRSFNSRPSRPVTLRTIMAMVKDGHTLYLEANDPFKIISNVTAGGVQ